MLQKLICYTLLLIIIVIAIVLAPIKKFTESLTKAIDAPLSVENVSIDLSSNLTISNFIFGEIDHPWLSAKEIVLKIPIEEWILGSFSSLDFTINDLVWEKQHIPMITGSLTRTHPDIWEGDAHLTLSINAIPITLTSHYLLDDQSSIQLTNILVESTKGVLKGNVTISTTTQTIVGNLQAMINEYTFQHFPSATGNLSFTLNHEGTNIQGNLLSPNIPPIDFMINLPTDTQAPISGQFTTHGEIAALQQLLFKDDVMLTGIADINITLGGNLETPKISGTCDIQNGSFEIMEIGTLLRHLNTHFDVSASQLSLTSLTADDPYGGTLTGTGKLLLDPSENLAFNIDMSLNQITILNRDEITASASGSLSFSGNSESGSLTGQLTTDTATIAIPERTRALVNYVEVTYINLSDCEPPPQSAVSPPSSWPLSLGINVQIPRTFNIISNDLTSTWKGDLSIQGNTQTPLYFGEIKIVSGQYMFNGKPFEINQGTITTMGEFEKGTSFYIIATKDLGKVSVDVIAKGPINTPVISFRSTPPLPQREILSWILFNRGSSEISSFQGSQLSESISNLDNISQSPDVLTKLRSTLGIDCFDIGKDPNSDEEGVNVSVGKYISNNVLVTVNKSDVNSVSVEASLSERFKVQAEVGDDSEGQILLQWKRDY